MRIFDILQNGPIQVKQKLGKTIWTQRSIWEVIFEAIEQLNKKKSLLKDQDLYWEKEFG